MPRRVLLVTDGAVHGDILRRQLEGWNITVDVSAGDLAAVRALHAATAEGKRYEAVVIDTPLTQPSGPTLANAIRDTASFGDVRILGFAPLRGVLAGAEMREAGLDACIAKPVRQLALRAALAVTGGTHDETAAPVAAAGEMPDFAEARILLAEDNAVNRRVALGQLRKLGCTAKGVANGREVLEAIARAPYDIILMDCQMPGLDGYETTRTIRARENDPAGSPDRPAPLHIIAMTAHAMAGDREKCLAAGMNDYITKPVLLPGLRAALERWRPAAPAASASGAAVA